MSWIRRAEMTRPVVERGGQRLLPHEASLFCLSAESLASESVMYPFALHIWRSQNARSVPLCCCGQRRMADG